MQWRKEGTCRLQGILYSLRGSPVLVFSLANRVFTRLHFVRQVLKKRPFVRKRPKVVLRIGNEGFVSVSHLYLNPPNEVY